MGIEEKGEREREREREREYKLDKTKKEDSGLI